MLTSEPALTKKLRSLWYDRSVRTQLLVVVGVINLVAAFGAGAVAIFNTRMATRLEIEASLEVAHRFVSTILKELAARGQIDQLTDHLSSQLKHLRHVRIMQTDGFGKLIVLMPQRGEADGAQAVPPVPKWFVALVRPKLVSRGVKVISIGRVAPVVIVGEPADEIAEAWQDFRLLALVWLALNALIIAALFVMLGRVLEPLKKLSRGMMKLEDGSYSTRLEEPKVRELAVITNRFNTLAGALDTARDENRRLYQQLISLQERERREIANELHDEAGPCLFGITANASSIRMLAAKIPIKKEVLQRLSEIVAITERLKSMNRNLLTKLRPDTLGQVKLAELVDELIVGVQRRHPDTRIVSSIGNLSKSYGETIDLTLYRCIQEGLTNAIRHGKAATAFVELVESTDGSVRGKASKPFILLTLRDDGTGFAPTTPKGFGLTAMTERVRSLGGKCVIESAPSKGTTIRVNISVPRVRLQRRGRPELVGDNP